MNAGSIIALVLMATLSAPAFNADCISSIVLIPPPTVIGINTDHSIRAAYLQRVRERKRKALKSDEFLDQFIGKKQQADFQIKPVDGAEKASNEISRLIKKMLAYDAVLNSHQSH